MTAEEKLTAIRKICFSIDEKIKADPTRWSGSLQWVTSQIMCVAKFGDGYPGQAGFPIGTTLGDIAPGESKTISISVEIKKI